MLLLPITLRYEVSHSSYSANNYTESITPAGNHDQLEKKEKKTEEAGNMATDTNVLWLISKFA